MTTEDRLNIKAGAKNQVWTHFSFYILLTILWIALTWIGNMISNQNSVSVMQSIAAGHQVNVTTGGSALAGVFSIVASMLQSGSQLTMIDIDRGTATLDNPMQRTFKLFEKSQYFWGWLWISILTFIMVFLWTLLLVIPGIVKAYAYSQAFYIYRDALDKGQPISALEAITQSRQLMDGSKGFLFIMDLSYIGWFILSALFMNIPDLFVMPYFYTAKAKFYNQLLVKKAGNHEPSHPDDPDEDDHVSIS